MRKFLRMILLTLAVVYLAFAAYVFLVSDRVIFQPHQSSYRDGPQILKVVSANGKKISALYLRNASARFTLLVSHGNAEDLGDDRVWLDDMRRAGFSVFAYDYQGYGSSEGSPSESAVYGDEMAAYDYLVNQLQVPPDRIIILGRSVGSGPALHLAARRPAAGLVLQSPFVSAFRVLTRFPLLPFDKFPNYREIRRVRYPVLIMHGTGDQVINIWHGRKLFELANEPKRFVAIQGADHNDMGPAVARAYMNALSEFAATLASRAEK